jgi:hypothetical protein
MGGEWRRRKNRRSTTQIEGSTIFAATLTKTLYFDHLPYRRKSQACCLLSNQSVYVGIIEFCNGPTLTANQELARVRTARITTSYKGIQGVETMHQIRLDQKLKGPVYGWRRGSTSFPIETVENLVGSCRLVAIPDQFEDATAQAGQAQTAGVADQFGTLERHFDAIIVVVVCRGKVNCGRCTVHGEQLVLYGDCTLCARVNSGHPRIQAVTNGHLRHRPPLAMPIPGSSDVDRVGGSPAHGKPPAAVHENPGTDPGRSRLELAKNSWMSRDWVISTIRRFQHKNRRTHAEHPVA